MKKWWFLINFVLWEKKIGLWAKQLGRGLSKLPSACLEEYGEDFSLKKEWYFIFFALWAKLLLTSAKYLRQGFRNFNLLVRRKILREKKVTKRWFLSNFVLWVKKKLDIGQHNLAGVVKAAIGVSRGIFWAFFIEKTMIFEWSLYFEQKKFRTWPKLYGRVSETSIYVSAEKLWERKNWKNDDYLVILKLWVKKNWTLGKAIGQVLSKLHSACVRIFHWKKDNFSYLFALWAKSLLTSAKYLRQGFRNFNLLVRRKILREKKVTKRWFLSNFVLWVKKKTGHWATQFSSGCQSCNRRVQGNLLSIFHWKNDDFWMKFVLWAKKVPDMAKTLRQGFRNFILCVRREIEREKKLKKRWLLSNFKTLSKKNWTLGKAIGQVLSKLHSACVRNFHWKKEVFSYLFALWAKSLLTSAK